MALQLKNQNSVIIGAPLVEPNDDLFWFGRPGFVLNLVHLTLFVMGSQFKSKTLEEKIATILKTWHAEVREKRKKQEQLFMQSPRTSLSTARGQISNSLAEFSSSPLPAPSNPTETNRVSIENEIIEEVEE
ncbi:MLO-like protein 3 [Forsythia ovata]|uniref:MLO-like protein 3 n=1 Tax=Forsythia ovata TaxID=205694 RepID=A0ABD1TPA8_9LAMI